jgi:hypothetical protein
VVSRSFRRPRARSEFRHASPSPGAERPLALEAGPGATANGRRIRGGGATVVERGLAMQAGMAADLRFEPEGVCCTLRLPPPPRAAHPEALG